jgi:hypothetical protein
MTPPVSIIAAARAEALFASTLATGSTPDAGQATQAIRTTVRAHGGVRGCAAEMAAAFGDHPDTAVQRMRWARVVVQTLFDPPGRCSTGRHDRRSPFDAVRGSDGAVRGQAASGRGRARVSVARRCPADITGAAAPSIEVR